MQIAVHQTAAAGLKERRRAWPEPVADGSTDGLSAKQMVPLNLVCASIYDKISSIVAGQNRERITRLNMKQPVVEYSRFAGFEHFPMRLAPTTAMLAVEIGGGGDSLGLAGAQGDATAAAVAAPSSDSMISDEVTFLGGPTIEQTAPPRIDFETVNRPRASFEGKSLVEVSDFVESAIELCEQIEKRDGMPPRTKKLQICSILFACFLDSVPLASDPIYKRTDSVVVQRKALEQVHRAMCTYVAACMSLPPDVDSVGKSCTTAFTMLTVFDTILRNTTPRIPLPFAAQIEKRAFSLACFHDTDESFETATSRMQIKHPSVLAARHEVCSYLQMINGSTEHPLLFSFSSAVSFTSDQDNTLKFVAAMCEKTGAVVLPQGSSFRCLSTTFHCLSTAFQTRHRQPATSGTTWAVRERPSTFNAVPCLCPLLVKCLPIVDPQTPLRPALALHFPWIRAHARTASEPPRATSRPAEPDWGEDP